jgi:aspartokinase-like uncharacterized kinase
MFMPPPSHGRPVVAKVGGSLFDLPDLGPRLTRWLHNRADAPLLLVPGGGRTGDLVRIYDREHGLGEETAHWLALRALTLNAWLLAALLRDVATQVVRKWEECPALWARRVVPVLDAHAFARADEGRPGCLPHTWSVTSDSVAARAAVVAGAGELVLLKSVSFPPEASWTDAAAAGWVDPYFPRLAGEMPLIRAVNFRAGP